MDSIWPADSVMATAAVWTFSSVSNHSVSVTNADLTTVVSEQQIPPDHGANTTFSTYQNNAGEKGKGDYEDMLSSNEDAGRRA